MPERHAVLTGPIQQSVFLQDGTEVDVRPEIAYVDTPEQAAEVAHLIAEYHAAPNTPEHPVFVGQSETFEYEAPEEFKDYTPSDQNSWVESKEV